jgi:hypothetical protein
VPHAAVSSLRASYRGSHMCRAMLWSEFYLDHTSNTLLVPTCGTDGVAATATMYGDRVLNHVPLEA